MDDVEGIKAAWRDWLRLHGQLKLGDTAQLWNAPLAPVSVQHERVGPTWVAIARTPDGVEVVL